ncbi:NCS2 family permease [Ornithinimicrobium flavum]|uniref:NCS2 family permease n=1 Tax=Ornithinimicrobium flavum TaxID=1288636 RepID=UPI00106F43ED|nr:NCS2 family permease [Ornithinimicrobium flavum]
MSTPARTSATRPGPSGGPLDSFFQISHRGSTLAREIRGGFVTFFAMAYIVVLNPLIIGTVPDGSGSFLADGNLATIAACTALAAGVLSIIMGVFANYPLALATGLGLNAFVAYGVASLDGMTWADAMGLVVIEGIVILVLVLTGFREAVFRAVPAQLKVAISVGIGLFITFIGLINSGAVRTPAGAAVPVELGVSGVLTGWPTVVFLVGLLLIAVLMVRKVQGAILYGIIVATVLAIVIEAIFTIGPQTPDGANPTGWSLTSPALPANLVSVPDFSLLGHFNLLGSFSALGFTAVFLLVFTLMLADFFDTMGTMVAVGAAGDLLDEEGNPPRTRSILVVDSLGAMAGGAAGVSSQTSYIESASGVGEGARTGLSSVVVGVLFLLTTFLSPLVAIVPQEAATPALVIVGFLMMQQVIGISWDDLEIALPAFLTIVLMPFTYSITAGIGAGFVTWVLLKVVRGKAAQVHPLMWIVALLFLFYFGIDPIRDLLGV